ncbi:MAG: DHH family phosphoesterase, partial [Anaerolineaceae bacterium]|nr:DHH family phosphoesterase [Anaerolineaceae bacterium]
DGLDAVAARAGAINPQTAWLLRFISLDAPVLLTDASPRFESVVHRYDTTHPDRPMRDAWAIANRTGGVTPLVNQDGTPYGLITGESLFAFLVKMVGPHPRNQEIKIKELLELPCRDAANDRIPKFQASTRIRDVIHRLLREDKDEFFVVDEAGHYIGICRQRDLLNPPRLKLVLVDHNEPQQAVGSLEEAELLEILDHHRLGNPSTHVPIKFTVDIVGSTSTLVSERIEQAGLSAPPKIAAMLLAGLLSDTLVLTSPTTTERDRQAGERLARWAFVGGSGLSTETIASFGQKILSASAGLGTRQPKDIVTSDMKVYNAGGIQFAIAQAEVSDLYEVSERLDVLQQALEDLKNSKGLDFAMLMVTDVVRGSSRLITTSPSPAILEELPYPPAQDGTRLAVGVVSRKKQLLPGILSLLEE